METRAAVETFVLDSWPIMEWMQHREPASATFEELIESAIRGESRLLMSRINFGEVLYSCWKLKRVDAAQLLADAEALPIDLISVDDRLVREAAVLKAGTTASYADCFAAALALRHAAPLVTGDPELRGLTRENPSLKLKWVGA